MSGFYADPVSCNWHRRWRETGMLAVGRPGKPRRSKLDPHEAFVIELVEARKDIALHEIAEALGYRSSLGTIVPPRDPDRRQRHVSDGLRN